MQPIERPAVTWEKAKMVLTALINIASIREVLVVGSVAREGEGNDLDIVLVVDIYTYITFLKEMWITSSPDDFYSDYRQERVDAAMTAIEMTAAEYGWLNLAMSKLGAGVDLHVMPEGWHENIDALQTHLPHSDPRFVSNIAGDATRLWTTDGLNNTKIVASRGEEVLAK